MNSWVVIDCAESRKEMFACRFLMAQSWILGMFGEGQLESGNSCNGMLHQNIGPPAVQEKRVGVERKND